MLAEVASSFMPASRASGAPRAAGAVGWLILVGCGARPRPPRAAVPARQRDRGSPRRAVTAAGYLRDLRLADFGSGRGSAPGDPNMPSTPRCEHTQIEIRIARSASARRLIDAGMTRP